MSWGDAVAWSMVGESLQTEAEDVTSLVAALEAQGWDRNRVRAHAVELATSGKRWPHPIPVALRDGVGAARVAAGVQALRAALDLVALEVRGPTTPRRFTADELRLLRDVPPHHGV